MESEKWRSSGEVESGEVKSEKWKVDSEKWRSSGEVKSGEVESGKWTVESGE